MNLGNNLTGDEALAVACSEKRIFTAASGTNTVQAYNMDGDSDGILTRLVESSLAIYHSNHHHT